MTGSPATVMVSSMSMGAARTNEPLSQSSQAQPSRSRLLAQLIRLSSQTGTLLLMLPTMWALMLAAQGRPSLTHLAVFATGAFLMRSAGVIMNDLADRRLDQHVARTQSRPLASGALRHRDAYFALAALLVLSAGLLLFLNQLAILLSPVALVLAALYPFSKRWFPLPQVMLGMAFGWGVVMAWAATRNMLEPQTWLLYGSTIAWAVTYDTIYALQDREDDLRAGIKSSAILFGRWTWLAVAMSFGLTLLCLGVAGWLSGTGIVFYGILAAVGGFVSQQILKLRRESSPLLAFTMFKQHVWIGWAILIGLWAGFL